MRINSIYNATEGEGILIGQPQVFVRFQGCAIGCKNCDSKYTWRFNNLPDRSLSDILQEIKSYSCLRISITGGDPLHPQHRRDLLQLVEALKRDGYWINIEAAGNVIVDEIFDLINFVSFDIKTPSTGVEFNSQLLKLMTEQYRGKFQVKAVVETREDFDFCLNLYRQLEVDQMDFPWSLTPAYNEGEKFPRERFISLLEWNQQSGGHFRVIGQQHKWIFGPNLQGV